MNLESIKNNVLKRMHSYMYPFYAIKYPIAKNNHTSSHDPTCPILENSYDKLIHKIKYKNINYPQYQIRSTY